MKELTIQEKAEAYDEAVKVIKDNLDALNEITETGVEVVNIQSIKNCFYRAFSELKESEDERIRKELINVINLAYDCGIAIIKENRDKYLTWIEKQYEKPQGKSAQEAINEKKVDNQNCIKPTNKVESKFEIKEGKWYVCIKDLLDSYANKAFYKGDTYLSTQDGSLMPFNSNVPFEVVYPDAYFRDWTIQDARDGNILAFDNNTIVMFKDLYNATTFHSYCHIEDGVFTASEKDVPDWWEGKGFHPATKEQEDQLKKAMTEAGYTFDFEKKELKKIGQNTAWSEEDEDMLQSILDEYKSMTTEKRNWLKSIKEKCTWKPSDGQMGH